MSTPVPFYGAGLIFIIMNKIKSLVLFICVLTMITACKKDDPKPSVEEQQLEQLIGIWKMSSVRVDNISINDQYKDFVLTIYKDGTDAKWVAANGAYAFPAVGIDSWSFVKDSNATKITRQSDNIEMEITLSDKNLKMEFSIIAPSGGRSKGLEGHFVFNLVKI